MADGCILPQPNASWVYADPGGECDAPPCCLDPPCCEAGRDLIASAWSCSARCADGFSQDPAGTYQFRCIGGENPGWDAPGSMPQPLCTPASENAYRTLAIVGFAVVSAFAWAVFVYTGYVQGRKGLLSAPGSHTPASALSRGSMKRRASSAKAAAGGGMAKTGAGEVCVWLSGPGRCCCGGRPREDDTPAGYQEIEDAAGVEGSRPCCCCYLLRPRALLTCLRKQWQAAKGWHMELVNVYGIKFVIFQILVNLLYGVGTGFWFFFLVYYLDVDLGLGPVDALALQGTLNLAPIFKPVMGLITDNLPLCGSHRRHYFCMAAAMGSLCYGLLFFLPASVVITAQGENNRIWIATLLLFFANFFGYSWSGVVLYSMTAEKARLDPVAGAANLNTLQWGWFAFGNLVADANVAWLYNTFGAQNCWLLSCVCFGIMAAMAFLYDDEVSIMKEFEGGCASQMRKLGECLNPFGVTRGTILRCIVFIFLTWAMTPDLFYGTTYYFYTASPCGPDGCCTAALTVDHNSCGRSESGGGCRCGGTARFPRPFDDTSNECDHDNFQGFAEYACQQGGDIDAGIPGEPQLQGSGREQCEATIAHGRGNGTGLAGICGPPGRYNGTGLPMYCRSIYNGRCYGQCGDPTISCWSLTTQESCEGNRRPEAGGGTWTNGCVRSVVGGVPEPAICETLTEDECNDSVDGGGSGGRWTPTTLEPWKPCCYYTEPTHGGLGFDAQFWAIIAILGDLAMMLASWAYGAFLTKSPLRPLFVLLQLLNTVAAVPDLILTLGLHDSLGIPAQVFAPIGIAAFWFAWQLKVLPVYTLAARICPSGVEATLMALISATNDVGGTVARYLGAFLTSILGITDVDFGNAWLLFLLRIVLTALPIIVVPLVPSEDAINEVCALVDAQESVSVGNDGKVHSTPATTADTRLQESPGVPTRRASTAAADISSSLSEPLMSSPIGQSSAYD